MITIEHDSDGYIVCRVADMLTKADYDAAVPELENALEVETGPLRMMIVLEDFRGWDIGGLWEEIKFDLRHHDDPGRVAVVGRRALEEWGTRLSKPFFSAEVRYYDIEERDAARRWLLEGPGAGEAR